MRGLTTFAAIVLGTAVPGCARTQAPPAALPIESSNTASEAKLASGPEAKQVGAPTSAGCDGAQGVLRCRPLQRLGRLRRAREFVRSQRLCRLRHLRPRHVQLELRRPRLPRRWK